MHRDLLSMEVFILDFTTVNNMVVKVVTKRGQIFTQIKCQSNRGNLEVADIPADYVMYWYPLSFYLDYHYMTNYKSILLKADPKLAPKDELAKYGDRNYFLHNFYDYKENKLGNDLTIYKLNLAITTKLKSMGLKAWDGFYNLQDVSYNYQLLGSSLEKVENKIVKREEEQGLNPNLMKNNPMDFATKEESTYLSDLGLGYKMTNMMRKIANEKFKGGSPLC